MSAAGAAPVVIPWSGPALAAKQRYLLSLSIVPQADSLAAQWFLDGAQVGAASVRSAPLSVRQDGSLTIGGPNGFAGVVDEFGVYTQDPKGRPSTDPGLYARAQALAYGSSLVAADGFDGIYLPDGFALSGMPPGASDGKGQIAGGSLSLPSGSGLVLPPLPAGDSAVSVKADLNAASVRTANLVLTWEGSSSAALSLPLAADASGLSFRIGPQGATVTVTSGGSDKPIAIPAPEIKGSNLLAAIVCPQDARSALIIDQVVAAKVR